MELLIEPKIALVDEELNIIVSGLAPKEEIKITATMRFPWASCEVYESFAQFTADLDGNVDLSKQKPDSGTYDYIDNMGLITSLQKVSSEGVNIALNLSIEESLFIDFTCTSNNGQSSVKVERLFKSPEVIRQSIHDEFVGELFYQNSTTDKTVIMLGGSDGERSGLSLLAGPLASRGVNVLTVGYFNEDTLPAKLEEIPLEYFEKVFSWIKKNPLTKDTDICIHGTSKGGELALLLASRYDFITKVVVSAPHGYCFQALDGMMSGKLVSSWSYGGKSLPFIPVKNELFFEHQKCCIEKDIPFGLATTYKRSVELAANRDKARIKIENAHADLLLIAGQDDNIWNTYEACVEIVGYLSKSNYIYDYKLLAYEGMGHSLPIPYIIPLSETLSIPMEKGVFTSGGTVKGNAHGQSDSWKKTIEFLCHS